LEFNAAVSTQPIGKLISDAFPIPMPPTLIWRHFEFTQNLLLLVFLRRARWLEKQKQYSVMAAGWKLPGRLKYLATTCIAVLIVNKAGPATAASVWMMKRNIAITLLLSSNLEE
jgi:hypothetical protein